MNRADAMMVVRKVQKAYAKDLPFWWGKLGKAGSIYIRYSHGRVQVFVCQGAGNPVNDGKVILNRQIAKWDVKDLETAVVKSALADVCQFED